MITQTSLLAYREAKTRLSSTQAQVLTAIKRIGPATNKQIASYLNWPINSVTPRVLELRQKKQVVQAYKDLDDSGRLAIYWKSANEPVTYED